MDYGGSYVALMHPSTARNRCRLSAARGHNRAQVERHDAGGSSATRLEGCDLRIWSSGRKSKRGTPSGVLNILVLATCTLPLAAAPRDCAEKPASAHLVDVKDKGARGDDRTDDTAAIQAAIDEIAGTGGTVLIPDGRYLVDAVGEKRLALRSDMTLMLANDAVLKAIPNDSGKYAVLSISGVSNVAVVGGTLEGERDEHEGKSGEWGMGIQIHRGAKHITISGVTVRKMWGDGFYVKGAKDVKFCFVTADNNRRQGLSIVEADGVVVTDSVFKNTRGTRPGAGIDLEPNKPGQRISSVRIQNSKFLDNAGAGI